MTLAFDVPASRPSIIARLDPRWKLSALLLYVLALVLLRSPGPALAGLLGALVLVAAGRLPWAWYLRRLGVALVMFTLFLLWLPLVVEDHHTTIQIGFVTLSLEGLARLGVLTAKLGAMLSLALLLLATAPLQDTFKAAHCLHVPGLLIQLVMLTYRYVFLIVEELSRIRTALRVRGFRAKTDAHTYRTIGQVAGTLLVRSHERAERVEQAMRSRGFDGEFRSLHEFRTQPADVLAFSLIVGYAALVLAWDLWTR